jgi:muramoyltetrapeptide carboxypeptidase
MQAPYLRAGDKIGLVAPARKITSLELAPALERFRSWGLEPITSKNLFGSSNQFSGTDEERAADMQEMLDDPTIRAVICARGGYGTLRIINRIDFTAFHKSPKWVLGFSDVTVLHSYIHAMGIETLHSPMPLPTR